MFYKKNNSKELDIALFKNPTSEYRGTPFWAWNCALNTQMLGEQIEVLKEMGFGGFHMHARTGITTPYLKEEFMDLIKFCVEKAKNEDMLAYLYDEDRWPSGSAGGYVTRNPKFRQRKLVFSPEAKETFPYEEALSEGKRFLLAVYDIILNSKGELSEYKKISPQDNVVGQKWYAYIDTAEEQPWYNNQTYVDTLNKEAIDEFIKITYEAYKNAVGDDFGKTVPSIFTDEPQFALKTPLGFADSNDEAVFPWTYSIANGFSKEYGYDITDKLPEIVWNLSDGKVSATRYHYHDYITELFVRNFADNCGKWCSEHGIALTGHILLEGNLFTQTKAVGEAMRSYRAFTIPGIDMLCDYIELATAKQCQSAVHQYGREAMLSELYGVTNWDFDFRGHKFQGDWQAALGVTLRVPHLSWVSMEGEAKRDYPASINYQSPWHKEYKYIEDHFARLNTALTRGKPHVKVAVIHPIESYWLSYGPGENTHSVRAQKDKDFSNLISWLLFGTIDFDFVSESLLPSLIKDDGDKKFKVGEMAYDVVFVPDCTTIRSSTLGILKDYHRAGGKIIFGGECPKYIDAVISNQAAELYQSCTHIPFNKNAILDALEEFREISIKNEDGSPTENLIYNMRDDQTCKWLFIAHGTKENVSPEDTRGQKITLKISGEYKVTLYNTLDGSIDTIPFSHKNGNTIVRYSLYQNDSILLCLTKEDCPSISEAENQSECAPSKVMHITNLVDYKRAEPNVYMLDRAEYSLDDEDFNPEEEVLTLDNICRKRMGWTIRGEQFPQPWAVPEEEVTHKITLRFKINSDIEVIGAKLAVERAEELNISLNGEAVLPVVDGWYVDKSIKTVPLPKINADENELVLTIPFGKRTHTEWCYIIGDFGVKVEGCVTTITNAPEKIGFSDLTTQGMPFYGGNIIYKTEVDVPDCDLLVRATYYRGALLKVFVDGDERGIIAFAPYQLRIPNLTAGKHTIEIKLFGTRINTFGGVHNVLQPDNWIGPDFWHSTGDRWSYEYQLKKTGLLKSPVIEIYEK